MFDELVDELSTHSTAWLEARRHEVICAQRELHTEELAIVRVLDSRGRIDPTIGAHGESARVVRDKVETARALESLPEIGRVAFEGGFSDEQLSQVVRLADEESDREWAVRAPKVDPIELARLVRNVEKPSAEDSRVRFGSRRHWMSWDPQKHMLRYGGQLPDLMGARFEATITRWAEQMKPAKGEAWLPFEQRAADALLMLCDPPAPADEHESSWAPLPILQFALPLHGPAEIAGIPISDSLLEQMRANVSIEPVVVDDDGSVIGIGGRTSALPPKLRRAVLLRDARCRVPGCGRRRGLEVHHMVPRSWDGTDEISNLAAVCPAHHRLLVPHGLLALVGNPNLPDGLQLVTAPPGPTVGTGMTAVIGSPASAAAVRSGSMPIELVPVPYGPDASRALHAAVAGAKAGDPLAPVTVIVPTNYVGVAARRLLGSGALGRVTQGGDGVAGVTFLTVYRLAELLGAPRLAAAQRRPVSTPVLAAAVRAVLADAPGRFAPVAHHPATEAALVAAHRELATLDDAALDALARTGPRAADVVRISRRARASLAGGWYDERDLMDAAAVDAEAGAPLLGDLGAVVVHLPQDLSAPAATLLRAVATRVPVTVVAGVSGDARADAPVRSALARLDLEVPDVPVAAPVATRVVSASDPDDEVRAVVRLVVEQVQSGVPLERMAVLYGAPDPYARLVHEQLAAAGIPHNGAAVRTLADSALGRGLLGLLSLPDRDFQRHDVMRLLATTPVYRGGRVVPSASWERISRVAEIVRGPDHWRQRLERHAGIVASELEAERAVTDRDPRPHRLERELADTRDLQEFVATLASDLRVDPAASWRDLVGWAERLVRQHLAPESRRADWPEVERQAGEKIDAALTRLAGLDAIETSPGVEVFRRTLELELDTDLGRVGRFGDGLLMGHVALGLGLDLDRVFVCGLAEGLFPTRVYDDSLLPDADRRATSGALPLHATRVDDDHRRLLAALAAAPERVLLFPRGDLRRTTERVPSRFLAECVDRATSGDGTVGGAVERLPEDLGVLHADWYSPIPSFAAGLARVEFPATEQEHRLRTLLDHGRAGGAIDDHELARVDVALARGVSTVVARSSRAFTRFDGNLAGYSVARVTDDGVVVSPTRLQSYAYNPHDYLLDHVLRVEIPELPEERYEVTPLDRGSLVHETLDAFLAEVLERPGGTPGADAPWTEADRTRMREIAEAHMAVYEAQGRTGRRLFWHRDRRRILAELDRFLTEDTKMRAGYGLRPIATELRFGFTDGAPAVDLPLSDGRSLRFRGAADRVDLTDTGTLWVLDYKTGRPIGVDRADPTSAGTMLQLPVYAYAARASFGTPDTPVGAAYWYVSTRGQFRWAELELDAAVDARVDTVLRAIADGIDAGTFPCRVDPPTTWTRRWRSYTDPDARGTRDRYREWLRKRDAPELRGYVGLAEPAVLEADEADEALDAHARTDAGAPT